jgi:hypothetical protein
LRSHKNGGEILRLPDGWDLAAWYPAGFRATLLEKEKPGKVAKRRTARERTRTSAHKHTKDTSAEHAHETQTATVALSKPQQIMALFRSAPDRDFTYVDIAQETGIARHVVQARVSELSNKDLLQKVEPGVFCLPKEKVPQIPLAG